MFKRKMTIISSMVVSSSLLLSGCSQKDIDQTSGLLDKAQTVANSIITTLNRLKDFGITKVEDLDKLQVPVSSQNPSDNTTTPSGNTATPSTGSTDTSGQTSTANLSGIKNFRIFYGSPSTDIVSDMSNVGAVIINADDYTKDQIAAIKKKGTKVFGYINTTHLQSYDTTIYNNMQSSDFMYLNGTKLRASSGSGAYIVDLSSTHMRSLLVNRITNELVGEGLDGVFFDTIDDIDEFKSKSGSSSAYATIFQKEMTGYETLLKDVSARYPNLLMMQNRGFDTFKTVSYKYMDAFLYEDFTYANATTDQWSKNQIAMVQSAAKTYGTKIFSCTTDGAQIQKTNDLAAQYGFVHIYQQNYETWLKSDSSAQNPATPPKNPGEPPSEPPTFPPPKGDDITPQNIISSKVIVSKSFKNASSKLGITSYFTILMHNNGEAGYNVVINPNDSLQSIKNKIPTNLPSNLKVSISSDNRLMIESTDNGTFYLVTDGMNLLGFTKEVSVPVAPTTPNPPPQTPVPPTVPTTPATPVNTGNLIADVRNMKIYYGGASSASLSNMTSYNLVDLEPSAYSKSQVDSIKAKGTKVLGYISIAELESYSSLTKSVVESDFLHDRNGKRIIDAGGYGCYILDLSQQHVRDLIISKIGNEILAKDFDGIFLDTVDDLEAPEDMGATTNENDATMLANMKQSQEGYEQLLIQIRQKYPNIIMVQNRAMELLDRYAKKYVNGILYEDFTYSHVYGDEWSQNRIKWLLKAKAQYGTVLFSSSLDSGEFAKSQAYAASLGFIHENYPSGNYGAW